MKKFLAEFKEFISRGNVIDLAVGVIIGGAFSAIVTSLTDNIIKPLINCIGGAEVQGKIHLVGDNYIDYGSFISAVINFLIMAFIIFCIVKAINKMLDLTKKKKNIRKKRQQLRFVLFAKAKFLLMQLNAVIAHPIYQKRMNNYYHGEKY